MMHRPGRLSGLEMEIEGGYPDRVRPGVPGAAGQLYGDAALFAAHGDGKVPMIPLDEACVLRGLSARQCMKDATGAAITSRPNLQRNTALFSAL